MNNNKIRLQKPYIYYKNQSKLKKWLVKFNIYFIFNLVLLKYKTLFVLMIFRKHTKKLFKYSLQNLR